MTSCETRYMWSGFVGSRQRNNMICTRSVRRVMLGCWIGDNSGLVQPYGASV